MFKVAILGCENSHANTFMNYITKSQKFPDLQIVGVYSDEPAACEKLHNNFGLYVAKSYDEFVGKIDGLIITARHGDNHYKYAKPYLESGIPMFIDKPITISEEEAVQFARELSENNVRITGGSCLIHERVIKNLRQIVQDKTYGEVLGGHFRAPLDMENPYGGFFFYSQHLVQMVCEVFGYYPESVRMCQTPNAYTAVFRYKDHIVTANYMDEDRIPVYYASIDCQQQIVGERCDLKGCFDTEFDEFYALLRGGQQKQSYADFIAPVFILNAMYRSLCSGQEEKIRKAEEI